MIWKLILEIIELKDGKYILLHESEWRGIQSEN